jgi:hypothetical protein
MAPLQPTASALVLERAFVSAGNVADWGVDQVTSWLEGLELHAVVPLVKENAVNGEDLLSLTEQELKDDLGCTALQARGTAAWRTA